MSGRKISFKSVIFISTILFSAGVLKASEKRPLPNINPGKKESLSLKDLSLAPLRAIFYPLYLITDYGIRKPIGSLATIAEKDKWYNHYVDFFSFGPHENEIGIFPNFSFESGFRPSFGLHAYWRNFPKKRNLPQLWVNWGGDDYTAFRFQNTYQLDQNKEKIIFNASKIDRPDFIFFGTGPDTLEEAESRYSLDDTEISFSYQNNFLDESKIKLDLTYFNRKVTDGDCCSDLTLTEAVDQGFFPTPSGFNSRYEVVAPQMKVGLGQRLTRPDEWYGGRITTFAQYNKRIDKSDASWTHYGGRLEGFRRIDNRHRLLTFGLNAAFVDKQGSIAVPFHELPGSTGKGELLGFKERRVVGKSLISSEYKWPIWAYADGVLHYSVGNSFGQTLEGFDFGRLKQSIGFGIRQTASFGPHFNFLVGLGSNTFDQGGDFNEQRLVIGGGSGF